MNSIESVAMTTDTAVSFTLLLVRFFASNTASMIFFGAIRALVLAGGTAIANGCKNRKFV